ncbi:MAG: S41 family peptidase [Victivallaceae bacterium]|nr:S41 family peptidase [Victivallaceae bacterium]
MKRRQIVFRLLLFPLLPVCSNVFAAPAPPRSEQVLNEVWNEVARRHFNPDFKHRYRKLYEKFKPAILNCRSDGELTREINKLLKVLEQSHTTLLPPTGSEAARIMTSISHNTAPGRKSGFPGAAVPDQPADTGITVSQTDNRICVIRVRAHSPAAAAGIRPGDIIQAINGLVLHPERKLYLGWPVIARALLSGRPGSRVKISLLNAVNANRTVTLTRQVNGEQWFKFGVLPRSYSDFYAAVLPENIGYVQFTAFTTPMLQRFRQAVVGKLRGVKGLIIDLRGNIGGMSIYLPWLAAWCCPKPVAFGKLTIHGTALQPKSFPQPECFKGRVAVLIDNYSCSCAEIFAAGMQDAKQARLFGTTTSGKCLPSLFLKLPSGFRLQTVAGSITRANGRGIERIGVKPDEKVILSLESLRHGQDNVIEAAKRWLLQ